MTPDTDLLHQEARAKLQEAMLSYPGDPVHVTIYAMHLSGALTWNDLQTALARTSHPSRPGRISTIVSTVDDHLETELRTYLGISR